MKQPNKDLVRYVESNILPRYDKCDAGHNRKHVDYVIRRSLAFAEQSGMDLDPDIVYTAAAYHDLGCLEDRKNHHIVSARMLMADGDLDVFLTPEQKSMAAEAAEDHRSSLGHPPRSVYGKLVASADRDTDTKNMLYRVYKYREKRAMPLDQLVPDAYEFVKERFGPGSGAKDTSWFPDPELDAMLAEVAELTADPDLFRTRLLEAAGQAPEKPKAEIARKRRQSAAARYQELTGQHGQDGKSDRDPTD